MGDIIGLITTIIVNKLVCLLDVKLGMQMKKRPQNKTTRAICAATWAEQAQIVMEILK